MRRAGGKYLLAIILVSLVVALLNCGKKEVAKKTDEDVIIPVEVFSVIRTALQNEITFTATVATIDQVYVQPKVLAEVKEIKRDKGNEVKKDEVLAELDTKDFAIRVEQAEAAVKVAQAQLTATQAELEQVESDYKRLEGLSKKEIISAQQFDSIKSKRKSILAQEKLGESQLERAKSQLREATLQLSYTKITSPIDGIITERFISAGEIAAPGKPLFKIVNLDPVKVIANVPEVLITNLAMGQAAKISADIDETRQFNGKISVIGPEIDPLTRTTAVEIITSNTQHLLKPGMFCRATLVVEERKNILAIPKEALLREGNVDYVFAVISDIAERRNVKLGIEQGGLIEISSGLKEGEFIVTSGKENLRTSSPVKIAKILEVKPE